MKIRYIIAVIALALLGGIPEAKAQVERPKLVVGLVIDQMRWDYLYYYDSQYGEGGIRRLLSEGFSCENNMINYVPTVTAIGHTSVYTGTTPALHGIANNNFFIDGKKVYCCTDTTVRSVGSNTKNGMMSPHRMLATTIGDELRIATDFRSKVIGVSLKDRAAILPAGHSANGAYWWDSDARCFVSSTHYMDALPQWAEKYNKSIKSYKGNPWSEPSGVTLVMDMALAALEGEQLGKHDDTDMLTISISSADAMGHQYSTRSPEMTAVYTQLDKDVKRLLDALDKTVGKGNYLLFLTADHAAAHNYNFMKEHKIPAGGFDGKIGELRDYLASLHPGCGNLVLGEDAYEIYFDHKAIAAAGLKLCDVKREATEWLCKDKRIHFVVDMPNAATATIPAPIREQIVNGWNPERSGDLLMLLRPQYFGAEDSKTYKGTTHGSWNPYDAHIPLIFMGWHVKSGSTNTVTHITDIAPTVCAMLHIQMPDACIGKPIIF